MIFGTIAGLRRAGVLGLNCRNSGYTLKYNRRRFYPLVDDKVLCKRRLQERGLEVPDLIALVEFNRQAAHLGELLGDHTEFVIKPAHGSGGSGIGAAQGPDQVIVIVGMVDSGATAARHVGPAPAVRVA